MQPLRNAEIINAITVCAASDTDIPLIIELARRIWPDAYEGILTAEQIANMLEKIYSPENLQAEMQDGHRFWIAYHGVDAIGFASAYREDAQIVWLKKIYVSLAMQGLGVGNQLIHTITDAFVPMTELRLLVNPNNIPAHGYYAHNGFTKTGEKPVRMGDWHFTDYIYSKPIKKD